MPDFRFKLMRKVTDFGGGVRTSTVIRLEPDGEEVQERVSYSCMNPDQLRKIELAVKQHEEALLRLKGLLNEMKSGDKDKQTALASNAESSSAWSRIFGG